MKYILLISIFLVGCGERDKKIVVDCERKEVLQFEFTFGDSYIVKTLPNLVVDSNCQVKFQKESK